MIHIKRLSCKEPECIKTHIEEDEDIELMLYVEQSETTIYNIMENGTLEVYDSDGNGQTIWLRCPSCEAKYEFNADYFEIKQCAKFSFDVKDKENLAITRVKKDWED